MPRMNIKTLICMVFLRYCILSDVQISSSHCILEFLDTEPECTAVFMSDDTDKKELILEKRNEPIRCNKCYLNSNILTLKNEGGSNNFYGCIKCNSGTDGNIYGERDMFLLRFASPDLSSSSTYYAKVTTSELNNLKNYRLHLYRKDETGTDVKVHVLDMPLLKKCGEFGTLKVKPHICDTLSFENPQERCVANFLPCYRPQKVNEKDFDGEKEVSTMLVEIDDASLNNGLVYLKENRYFCSGKDLNILKDEVIDLDEVFKVAENELNLAEFRLSANLEKIDEIISRLIFNNKSVEKEFISDYGKILLLKSEKYRNFFFLRDNLGKNISFLCGDITPSFEIKKLTTDQQVAGSEWVKTKKRIRNNNIITSVCIKFIYKGEHCCSINIENLNILHSPHLFSKIFDRTTNNFNSDSYEFTQFTFFSIRPKDGIHLFNKAEVVCNIKVFNTDFLLSVIFHSLYRIWGFQNGVNPLSYSFILEDNDVNSLTVNLKQIENLRKFKKWVDDKRPALYYEEFDHSGEFDKISYEQIANAFNNPNSTVLSEQVQSILNGDFLYNREFLHFNILCLCDMNADGNLILKHLKNLRINAYEVSKSTAFKYIKRGNRIYKLFHYKYLLNNTSRIDMFKRIKDFKRIYKKLKMSGCVHILKVKTEYLTSITVEKNKKRKITQQTNKGAKKRKINCD